VLELRDEADPAVQLAGELVAQVDDLLEGRDRVAAVVDRIALAQVGRRSFARSVLSSASVKSSVNQSCANVVPS
jgi:hypothetical protein